MRVDRALKWTFYISFTLLYLSGALEYAVAIAVGSPSPTQSLLLRVHGVVGLWFLYLFGHFFKAHIWPSLRQIRHRKTGITVWVILSILCLSVPFLYYLSNDWQRELTIFIHTYLGLIVLIPLVAHIYLAICRK